MTKYIRTITTEYTTQSLRGREQFSYRKVVTPQTTDVGMNEKKLTSSVVNNCVKSKQFLLSNKYCHAVGGPRRNLSPWTMYGSHKRSPRTMHSRHWWPPPPPPFPRAVYGPP